MSADQQGTPSDAVRNLLTQAFDAAPNGFVLTDEAGRIILVNQELSRMFGYTLEDMTGMLVDALLPFDLRPAHAIRRQDYLKAPERRPMGGGRVLHALHADGHTFPVEIGLTPLKQEDGQRYVLASVVDVSDRQGLATAFQGLFDASPYGLLLVNDEGIIVKSNAALAASLGYDRESLSGRALSTLLPERYRTQHTQLTRGYAKEGGARMMGQGRDLTALHADGTEVSVEIGLNRVQWQRQPMTLAVITDISVRKRMEADLKQANADLQEFTYVASHDLRSPLRGIADLVQWIGQDLEANNVDEVKRNLERVSTRITKMESLIDDLLRYARAGKVEIDYKTADLTSMLANIAELQPMPEGFTLSSDLQAPPFQAVLTPLETVLRNLISNAIKHHDQASGHVHVTAKPDGNHILIAVTDDGPGIPQQASQRIFRLFQTLTASNRGNSGIGLALCKRLTEVHGGRIDVISPVTAERGTQFRVWWPRYQRKTKDE